LSGSAYSFSALLPFKISTPAFVLASFEVHQYSQSLTALWVVVLLWGDRLEVVKPPSRDTVFVGEAGF
jgi:hypothetical protein